MSANAEPQENTAGRYVTFRLGAETYALDVLKVREIQRLSEIAPVPGAPPHILGLINLRGSLVTVIDTRSRLGVANPANNYGSRIIIVEQDGMTLGLLVDSVIAVVDAESTELMLPPGLAGGRTTGVVSGVLEHHGTMQMVVGLGRFCRGRDWQVGG